MVALLAERVTSRTGSDKVVRAGGPLPLSLVWGVNEIEMSLNSNISSVRRALRNTHELQVAVKLRLLGILY